MKKTNLMLIAFFLILATFLIVWFSINQTDKGGEINYEEIVRQYIEENISELSPEPEVLGGSFYVTNINFLENNLIFIEYEDGHIALEAEAKYSIINNEIIIDYFRLIEDRDITSMSAINQGLVSNYISENISQLSPKEAVLGGTFFVVNIDFIDDNLAIVEYEDGHVALEAQAIYSVVDNQVVINSFRLIERELEDELSGDDIVSNYISENISQLSPKEAVLGGTFFVVNIDFIDDNLAIVEYEDGHIALEAQAIYSVVDNQVVINSFRLIEREQEDELSSDDIVTNYISENISQLSPKEAVLGGTFFVVNIDFIDDNLAIVEYEDGHIALEAQVTYSISNNQVNIESFIIQEDEINGEDDIILSRNDLVSNYINENISELSPEPAVLGGTFFVVNIDFIDDNLAIVEYEDGHIALEAIFNFEIENDQVVALSFDLVE